MTRDTIKYIAILAMLINHIGIIFMKPPLSEVMVDIGYFTAITMCWFLVEGYRHTRSVKKYGLRLLLCACLSQLPFSLAFPGDRIPVFGIEFYMLNMIFNLFFCFLIIHLYHSCRDAYKRSLYIAGLFLAGLFCDWSCIAPAFVLLFLWAGGSRGRQFQAWTLSVCLVGIEHFLSYAEYSPLIPSIRHGLFSMTGPAAAAVCILFFYNGRKSVRMTGFHKWFFYIFYPLHLLILGIVRLAVG